MSIGTPMPRALVCTRFEIFEIVVLQMRACTQVRHDCPPETLLAVLTKAVQQDTFAAAGSQAQAQHAVRRRHSVLWLCCALERVLGGFIGLSHGDLIPGCVVCASCGVESPSALPGASHQGSGAQYRNPHSPSALLLWQPT